MNDKIEILKARLEKEIVQAEQEAYYARSGDENYHFLTRAEALKWCYNEVIKIFREDDNNQDITPQPDAMTQQNLPTETE